VDDILEAVVRWAESEVPIRALILTSSRAGAGEADEFSDYDLMVVTDDADRYLASDTWIKGIRPLWVYIKEQFPHGADLIPTRLVIYENGVKVDFSFWNTRILRDFVMHGFSGTDDLNRGYRVLMDKDGLAAKLPLPAIKFFEVSKLTEAEFLSTIHEFWFEVAAIAKYLARGDLYPAKNRENGILKDLLLRMIIWNVQAKNHWTARTHTDGKRMRAWVDDQTLQSLRETYSGFDLRESWKSLTAGMEFFRKISGETAQLLGYEYPHIVDTAVSGYVVELRRRYCDSPDGK
jgi:aminoglycoside 6-adenylyltransferase